MTELTGVNFTFKAVNPVSFYFSKVRSGVPRGFTVVMTILHFLPRFQNEPEISANFKMLTGKEPTTLKAFILREREKIMNAQNAY